MKPTTIRESPQGPTSLVPRSIGSGMRDRIVLMMLLASLLPSLLVGIGAWNGSSRQLDRSTMALHKAIVSAHASTIERYLEERVRLLDFASRSAALETLGTQDGLG
ncbi:MAG: hypothetical protein HY816_18880, partial [Candidatus Wallbacteria bacterium]|nr:hypothetical protein [Candidatus Wallbacteria bacterium]